jgi:hypothetical protein
MYTKIYSGVVSKDGIFMDVRSQFCDNSGVAMKNYLKQTKRRVKSINNNK